VSRLTGEIQALKIVAAKADGAKEQLQEQVAVLREEARGLGEAVALANQRTDEANRMLLESQTENARYQQREPAPLADEKD
jgi:hypothetical protein